MDGWADLDVDFVPAVGPVLGRVSEERLHGTHLAGILHPYDKFTVLEPFLGANLTGKVVGLGGASNDQSCKLLHLLLRG